MAAMPIKSCRGLGNALPMSRAYQNLAKMENLTNPPQRTISLVALLGYAVENFLAIHAEDAVVVEDDAAKSR